MRRHIINSGLALLLCANANAGVQTAENTRWIGVTPTTSEQNGLDAIGNDGITRVYDNGFGTYTWGVEDKGLWGGSGGQTNLNLSLTSEQWDAVFGRPPRARLGVGTVEEVCVPLVGCPKAGAAAGVQLEAYVLPYVELDYDPGSFDATVSYAPTAKYQSTGLGLDFSRIETTDGGPTGSLDIDSPAFSLEAGVTIEPVISLFVEACLVGCFLDEKFPLFELDPLDLPLVNIDTAPESGDPVFEVFYPDLARLAEASIAVEDLILDPVGTLTDTAREAIYVDASALLSELGEQAAEGDSAAAKAAQATRDAADAVRGILDDGAVIIGFSNPWAEDTVQISGFSGSLGGELLTVELDVTKIIGYAFGLTDGLTFDLERFGIKDPVSGSVTLGNAKAGPIVDLLTEVSLETELMVDLQFDSEVYLAGKIGKQTSYYGKWEDLPAIGLTADAYILGENDFGALETPDDKTVRATPEFSIQAEFNNRTYLDLKATASLELLSAEIGIEGLPSLTIGPVLEYEVESDSLGQLDLYNGSFAVDMGEYTRDTSGTTTDALEFNAFGEIIFQARGKGEKFDKFYDQDDRISQNLSTSDVLNALSTRADAVAPDGNGIYQYIQALSGGYGSLKETFADELKIDNRTAAHVMIDGMFTNDRGKQLTIEAGGNLELGKENSYERRSLANERLAESSSDAGGFVNNGVVEVHGEIFSNATIENPNYVFRNSSKADAGGSKTPVLKVGASGRVKFDGTFENDGFVQNFGSIELTGEKNRSSNAWDNRYGSNLDVYGKLDVSRQDPFAALTNNGTTTAHSGSELTISSSDVDNFGQLDIRSGAELRLTGDLGSELRNRGTVENSGYVRNTSGQLITNGTSVLAFDALLGQDGSWESGQANQARESGQALVEGAYTNFLDVNAAMESQVQRVRNARVNLLATNNDPSARARLVEPLYDRNGVLQGYRQPDTGTLALAYAMVQDAITSMTASGFAVWENLSGGLLVNEGTFDNNAVVVNNVDGSIFNSGELNNAGYLKNAGLLVNNQPDGIVENTGRLDNGDSALGLVGLSEVVNLGNLNNRGELVNHDTLSNYGVLQNRDDGTGRTENTVLLNNGSLTNLGTLDNAATLANNQGAQVLNYGTINNTGELENHGFINNGVLGTNGTQSDIAATADAAGGFYAAIQSLHNSKQDLENINQQYENEAARLRRIGFMGLLNEGETGENTEAWATYLYEKYLVSNLADQSEFAEFYGPQLGSLEADRAFIRSEVIEKSGSSTVSSACASSLLACYKYYFGYRQSGNGIYGDVDSAINYDFSSFTGENAGIQWLSQYKLSSNLSNDDVDDENRFLWTLLMMMEAEGVSGGATAVLNCARNDNCKNNPQGESNQQLQEFNRFFDGYGSSGNEIEGLDGYYASWIDEIAFRSDYYKTGGFDLSLKDVGAFGGHPLVNLADLYHSRSAEIERISSTINSNNLASLGFDGGSIPDLSSVGGVDVRALLSGLGSALSTASFDLSAVTSLDAELNNTGTINNRGVISNRANLNNEEGGVINNSGALVIGATGTLTNAGDVLLTDYALANGDVQNGFVMSHGTIDNEATGLIEVFAGTLLNGVLAAEDADTKEITVLSTGVINNRGEIKLSASAGFEVVDGKAEFVFSNANLVNEGTLNNFAGALLQIGMEDAFIQENRLFSLNVLDNSGDIYNDGTLANFGTIRNSGLIENRAGSTFTNKSLINNTATGLISFEDSASLGGEIVNNGLVAMAANEILTLTGRISGNGTFAGDTLLQGATVSPGNSPGLLTFDGDVTADAVNWVLEIWGTERGAPGGYDGVDITGDLTLVNGMELNILSLLDFSAISSQSFNFLSIAGNLINMGAAVTTATLDFVGFDSRMMGYWDGEWVNDNGVWSLLLSFIGTQEQYEELYGEFQLAFRALQGPVAGVPLPGTLPVLMLGLLFLWRLGGRRPGRVGGQVS